MLVAGTADSQEGSEFVMQVANFVYLYTGKEYLIRTMHNVMEYGVDDAADIMDSGRYLEC